MATDVECRGCGRRLRERSDAKRRPCPYCGSLARSFSAAGSVTLSASVSAEWEHVRMFYERHRVLQAIALAVAIGGPVLGLMIHGYVGLALGLALGLFGYWVGPRAATTTVQRVEHGHSG